MEKNMVIQNGQRFLGDLRYQDATSGSLRTARPSAAPVKVDNGGEKDEDTFISKLRGALGTEEGKDDEDDVEVTGPKAEDEYDESDYVTYTYKPGDTFGNVLLKTGLATDKGLWGSDGDVAYYNKQLVDTKLNPALGGKLSNIPVGTKIKLLKRGATPKSKK